jgi:hypothetical protein
MRLRGALIFAAAASLVAAPATHAATKSVKDWTAACDNTRACAAFGFSPEGGDVDSYLIVKRAAGAAAQPTATLVYDAPDKQPARTVSLALDGKPIAEFGAVRLEGGDDGARATLVGRSAQELIKTILGGRTLSLRQGGNDLVDISLAGSAAVLLWVDDQQGRVGTVTALARPGPKPASAALAPAPVPLIAAAPPASQAGLPAHAPNGLIKDDPDCDPQGVAEAGSPDGVVARLAPGVVLWGPICQVAAYNELNVFFLGDEHAGHLKQLSFEEPPGSDPPRDDTLMNVGFDAKTQTLTSFAKGRGIGDCGEAASWIWDGKAFRLASETAMAVCRGVVPDDWPTLFVSRRR